jgi:hypothetical protein
MGTAHGMAAWLKGGTTGTVIVVGVIATAAGVAAVASTPAGQRSLSTFTSAAHDSFSHSVSTIKSWFHHSDNSKTAPAPQSNPAPGTQTKADTQPGTETGTIYSDKEWQTICGKGTISQIHRKPEAQMMVVIERKRR